MLRPRRRAAVRRARRRPPAIPGVDGGENSRLNGACPLTGSYLAASTRSEPNHPDCRRTVSTKALSTRRDNTNLPSRGVGQFESCRHRFRKRHRRRGVRRTAAYDPSRLSGSPDRMSAPWGEADISSGMTGLAASRPSRSSTAQLALPETRHSSQPSPHFFEPFSMRWRESHGLTATPPLGFVLGPPSFPSASRWSAAMDESWGASPKSSCRMPKSKMRG